MCLNDNRPIHQHYCLDLKTEYKFKREIIKIIYICNKKNVISLNVLFITPNERTIILIFFSLSSIYLIINSLFSNGILLRPKFKCKFQLCFIDPFSCPFPCLFFFVYFFCWNFIQFLQLPKWHHLTLFIPSLLGSSNWKECVKT